jgi:hypothetical protein
LWAGRSSPIAGGSPPPPPGPAAAGSGRGTRAATRSRPARPRSPGELAAEIQPQREVPPRRSLLAPWPPSSPCRPIIARRQPDCAAAGAKWRRRRGASEEARCPRHGDHLLEIRRRVGNGPVGVDHPLAAHRLAIRRGAGPATAAWG